MGNPKDPPGLDATTSAAAASSHTIAVDDEKAAVAHLLPCVAQALGITDEEENETKAPAIATEVVIVNPPPPTEPSTQLTVAAAAAAASKNDRTPLPATTPTTDDDKMNLLPAAVATALGIPVSEVASSEKMQSSHSNRMSNARPTLMSLAPDVRRSATQLPQFSSGGPSVGAPPPLLPPPPSTRPPMPTISAASTTTTTTTTTTTISSSSTASNAVLPLTHVAAQEIPSQSSPAEQPDLLHRQPLPPLAPPAPLTNIQHSQLRAWGYPAGLIAALGELRQHVRFFAVDNSGSMLSPDGKALRGAAHTTTTHNSMERGGGGLQQQHPQQNYYVVECTRWAELSSCLTWHATCAGILQSHTVFCLLHATSQGQFFAVADPDESGRSSTNNSRNQPWERQGDVRRFHDVIRKIKPQGSSPLVQQLQQIQAAVAVMAPTLVERDVKAIVVLCTDGVPTDATGLAHALRVFQQLPVWIVIRLCSDDPSVVEYYNQLDEDPELNLEVIDDFFAEAAQVARHNPWINYALPLHRCREMGLQHRVLDFIDERALTRDEIVDFIELLLGKSVLTLCPDVHADWKGFCRVVQRVVEAEPAQYNPVTRQLEPWINTNVLYHKGKRKGKLWGFFKSRRW